MSRLFRLVWARCFLQQQGSLQSLGLGLGREVFTFLVCPFGADSLCWAQTFSGKELIKQICLISAFSFFLSFFFFFKGFSILLFFFFKLINLFLAVLGLRFCARAFSSCGKRGPLFIAVRGPLTIAASLVAEHRLQMRRLSSCGSRA